MKDPMDILNEETVTVELDAREMAVIFKGIILYETFIPQDHPDNGYIESFRKKIQPEILKKAAKAAQLQRDKLN